MAPQECLPQRVPATTLRLVLAERVTLVEGPSDELVVQRAYLDAHGKLPIKDGVDVISVRGLQAKRFLDIAVQPEKPVVVVARAA